MTGSWGSNYLYWSAVKSKGFFCQHVQFPSYSKNNLTGQVEKISERDGEMKELWEVMWWKADAIMIGAALEKITAHPDTHTEFTCFYSE